MSMSFMIVFFFSILSIVYINIVYINMGTKYTILRYTYTYYIPKGSTSACLLFFDPSMSGIRGRQGQDEGVQGLRRGPEGARWCGGAPRAIGLWFCEAKIGGFLSHGGTQIAGFFLKENPNLKWMRTGGTPHFRKPPYNFYNIQSSVDLPLLQQNPTGGRHEVGPVAPSSHTACINSDEAWYSQRTMNNVTTYIWMIFWECISPSDDDCFLMIALCRRWPPRRCPGAHRPLFYKPTYHRCPPVMWTLGNKKPWTSSLYPLTFQ